MICSGVDYPDAEFSNRAALANVMLNTAAQLYRPRQGLQTYRLNDWLEFVLWLDKVSILLPLVSVGAVFPFDPVAKVVRKKADQHKARQNLINNELERFARCAKNNQLRFISLKGSALSTILYGSPYARQSTDIDILVEANDCNKVGYVANQCGFKQPLEYYALRDEGDLGKDFNSWLMAPFQIRRKQDSDSLSEYVKVIDSQPIVIDVHDRLSRIGQPELRVFSWRTSCVSIGATKVNSLAGSALVAYLMLASYDDSEGYAPNSKRGTLGLKLYYDLLASLFSMGEACFKQAVEMLCGMGEIDKVAKVIANLIDIFPGQFGFLSSIGIGLPSTSYRNRFMNLSTRKSIALSEALVTLTGPQQCNAISEGEKREIRWDVCCNVAVSVRLTVKENLVHAVWTVPNAVLSDIACFVLQFRLSLCEPSSSTAEIRANMFLEDGEMLCDVATSPCFSRSGKGDKVCRGVAAKVEDLGCSGGSVRYTIDFDLRAVAKDAVHRKMLVNGGVFKNHCGPIYHEIWRGEMTIDGFPMLDVKL